MDLDAEKVTYDNDIVSSVNNGIDYFKIGCLKSAWDESIMMDRTYDQTLQIMGELSKAVEKTENELMEKWDINYIGVSENDNGYLMKPYDKITDKFFYSQSMEEIKASTEIEETKKDILEAFYTEIDMQTNNLSTTEINEIKKDAEEIFSKYYDQTIDSMFNNEVRDKLEMLCNNWNKAYEKLDIDKMNMNADAIKEILKKEIYRDPDLSLKARRTVVENDYINKKISDGEERKLSEHEVALIKLLIN